MKFDTFNAVVGTLLAVSGVVLAWVAKKRSEPTIVINCSGVGCYGGNGGYRFTASLTIENRSNIATTLKKPRLVFTEKLWNYGTKIKTWVTSCSKPVSEEGTVELYYGKLGENEQYKSQLKVEPGEIIHTDLAAKVLMGIPATWKLQPQEPNKGTLIGILMIDNSFGRRICNTVDCTVMPWKGKL